MSLSAREQQALDSITDLLADSIPACSVADGVHPAGIGRGDAAAREDPGWPAPGDPVSAPPAAAPARR